MRKRGRKPEDLLGNSGVGLAGDAFDARLVRKLVSPALGSELFARSLSKVLPAVPAWIYATSNAGITFRSYAQRMSMRFWERSTPRPGAGKN